MAAGITPNSQAHPSDTELRGAHLTARERQVLLRVAKGHSNTAIAQHLGVTEARVKAHLQNLQRKIRVKDRVQAAVCALAKLPELNPRIAA